MLVLVVSWRPVSVQMVAPLRVAVSFCGSSVSCYFCIYFIDWLVNWLTFRCVVRSTVCVSPAVRAPRTERPCQWRWSSVSCFESDTPLAGSTSAQRWTAWEGLSSLFSLPNCHILLLKPSFSFWWLSFCWFNIFCCFSTPYFGTCCLFVFSCILYTSLFPPSLPTSVPLLLAPPDFVCPGGKYLAVIRILASLHVELSKGIRASGCHSVWFSRPLGATCTRWLSSWCPLTCWSCGSSWAWSYCWPSISRLVLGTDLILSCQHFEAFMRRLIFLLLNFFRKKWY